MISSSILYRIWNLCNSLGLNTASDKSTTNFLSFFLHSYFFLSFFITHALLIFFLTLSFFLSILSSFEFVANYKLIIKLFATKFV